jgi:hypothetical protein
MRKSERERERCARGSRKPPEEPHSLVRAKTSMRAAFPHFSSPQARGGWGRSPPYHVPGDVAFSPHVNDRYAVLFPMTVFVVRPATLAMALRVATLAFIRIDIRLAPSGVRVAEKMFTHWLAPVRLRARMESTNAEGSMRVPSETPPDHDRTAGRVGSEKSTEPVSLNTPDHGAVSSDGSSGQVRLRTFRASQRCRGPRGSVAHVAAPTSGGLGGGGGRGGGAGGRGGDHHGMLGGPGRGVDPVPIHVVGICEFDVASTRLSPRTRTVQHGI